ncbi:DUF3426 domain-containing protein [Variovorax sp. dw_954]|uniref:DUF3426 domain-containing protein n=1 Tax=Variovorax sp. dw_954 TaxID=2720078 RepID=UPI001BD3AEAD|nr:DUF3426 domain-containing protein [Variovorax sp. dw_954]
MSLVTRCPSCETTFKVVRDQLRISDGWVRCGRCSQVFDATLELREAPDAVSMPAAPAGEAVEPKVAEAAEEHDEPLIEIDLPIDAPEPQLARMALTRKDSQGEDEGETNPKSEPEAGPGPETEPESESEPGPEPASGPEQEQEQEPGLEPESEPQPESNLQLQPAFPDAATFAPHPDWPSLDLIADDPWPSSFTESPTAEPASAAPSTESVPALAQHSLTSSIAALDDFSAFVDQSGNAQLQKALRQARIEAVRNARARRAAAAAASGEEAPLPAPVVTSASIIEAPAEPAAALPPFAQAPAAVRSERRSGGFIIVALILLAVLLGLQWARHERDALVAREPSLRPVVEVLCKFTGCEISALRQISAITIDGASFARDKTGDGYRLDFTLRSNATTPLAMPAVELSLLDTQERTVVRRVLMPADFGAPAVLGAKAERVASLPLALSGPDAAAMSPVAGYRVVAFYP